MPLRDQDADLERISKQDNHWNRLRTDPAYRQHVAETSQFRIEAMLDLICEEMGLEAPPKMQMEDSVVRAARPSDLKDAGETPSLVDKADPEVPAPQAMQVGGEELSQGSSLTGEEILNRGYTGGYNLPIDSSDEVVRQHNADKTVGEADPDAHKAQQDEEEKAEDTSGDPHYPGEPRDAEYSAMEMAEKATQDAESVEESAEEEKPKRTRKSKADKEAEAAAEAETTESNEGEGSAQTEES